MDLIISHNGCPDGWAAAYIAKKRYPEAEILLLDHGIDATPVIDKMRDKYVIMLDYSFRTRGLNQAANAYAASFRILDHHKTAQAELEGLHFATFDMKRSGAGLAWDYLFGKDSGNTCDICDHNEADGRHSGHRPWWVNYTEDQDLWNWALPNSQEINAYLMTQHRTVENWDIITTIDVGKAIQLGVGTRAYIEYYTREVIKHAVTGLFEGWSVAVLNMPYLGVSEACGKLAETHDIGMAWFERADGIVQFSLRSRGKDAADVSAIAKKYGGGGHFNAAGFQLPLAEGRRLVDRILGRVEVNLGRCA